ncbi:MAG TPA: hypothetical protein VL625_11050 [Patescibacteria group bacterium]|nr:hypothetical protein [Patescibacteria group bacterium]
MSLGTIEFDQPFNGFENSPGKIGSFPALSVKKQALVIAFEQVVNRVSQLDRVTIFGNMIDKHHYEVDPHSTRIILATTNGDHSASYKPDNDSIIVPFSYEAVGRLLADARKNDATVDFTVSNQSRLRAQLGGMNGPD